MGLFLLRGDQAPHEEFTGHFPRAQRVRSKALVCALFTVMPMNTADVYPEERLLIERLAGTFVSLFDIEDVRVANVPMDTTNFTLQVAAAWVAFSRNQRQSSGENIVTLKFFPDYRRIRCIHDTAAGLSAQTGIQAVDMVNAWLSQGAQRVEEVSVNISEVLFVLDDGRFLALCAEPRSIGIIGGSSASAYRHSRI